MSADGFLYEGRDITARALKREIPAYGEATLQSALEAGMQTRDAVIGYCERRLVQARATSTKAARASDFSASRYFKRKRVAG